MLIIEFIDVKFDHGFLGSVWKARFENQGYYDEKGPVSGKFVTNKSLGNIESYMMSRASRIIDTDNWGILKDTTGKLKVITEEMKEDYLFVALTAEQI